MTVYSSPGIHSKHMLYHFPFINFKKKGRGLFLKDKGKFQAFHWCLHSSLLNHHGGKRGGKKTIANNLLTAILPCLLCAMRTASDSPWQLRSRVSMGASRLRCWWTHTGLSWAEGSEPVASPAKTEEDSRLTWSEVFPLFLLQSMPSTLFPLTNFPFSLSSLSLGPCQFFEKYKGVSFYYLSYIPQN